MFILHPFSKEALALHPFNCGEPELDSWLTEFAGQNEKKNNARTMLLLDEEAGRIAGYSTMLAFQLSADEAHAADGRKPRYSVPAMLIARIAVDVDYKGRGLGQLLLNSALERLVTVAETVGFELVVVHALHEKAANFYLKYGFRPFLDHELHLYLPTKNLRATYASTERS